MEWYQLLAAEVLGDDSLCSTPALRGGLERQIISLYQAILSYQMQSVCLYKRKVIPTLLRDFLKLDDWDGKLNSIHGTESALEQKLNSVNNFQTQNKLRHLRNNTDMQLVELKKILNIMHVQSARELEFRQDERVNKFLQDVRTTDPRDDKTRIEHEKGGLLRASSQWVLDHKYFQRWKEPEGRLLWIKGDAGKGKTMLVCGIIEHLDDANPCYFFCEADRPGHCTATDVARGLIFLLAEEHPDLIHYGLEKHKTSGKELFSGPNAWVAVSAILENMLRDPILQGKMIIIDALDECGADVQSLLKMILKSSSSGHVKWLLSSRNKRHIERELRGILQESSLCLEDSENATEISEAVKSYIDYQVSNLLVTQDDPDLMKQVKDTFRSKSQGTFLWVSLVAKELENALESEIDEILEDLPEGLDSLYDRMLGQIDGLPRKAPGYCRSLLSTLLVAYRPLQVKEAGVLAGLPPSALKKDELIKEYIQMCGSFLTVQEETVHFVHLSAKDFLQGSGAGRVLVDGASAQHHWIFTRSLNLLFQVLKHNLYSLKSPGALVPGRPQPDPLSPARYSCEFWIDHFWDAMPAGISSSQADDDPGGYILKFFEHCFLFWLEALCCDGDIPRILLMLNKLQDLLVSHKGFPILLL